MASTPWRRAAWLVLAALVLHVAGAWSLPLVDRDEPRFAEASREMWFGGDWLVPHFNHGYRFDKPILIYWLQALSLGGLGDSEFAVRLPSVAATALTAALVYGFGRRAAGEAAGLWASGIYSTALQTLVHAKMAVADPLLILWTTLGFWAGWELTRPSEAPPAPFWRRGWWWVFYSAQGLAFLAKGPIGWVPLLTVLVLWRRVPGMGRRMSVAPGVVWMTALAAAWGVPALVATHGEFFAVGIGKHVVQRSVGAMEGHGLGGFAGYLATLPLYFLTVFSSFFPWSVFLPWLVKTVWADRGRPWLETYAAAGVLVVFVLFTLVRTKLPHYTLPAFPLLALGLAARWARAGRPWDPFHRALGLGAALGLTVSLVVLPRIAGLFPARNLFLAAESSLLPEMEFASADFQEPSLVWCFRARVRGYYSPLAASELPAFMDRPGPRFCVAPTADAGRLWPSPPAHWRRFDTAGLNLVHGRRVALTLLLKPN